MKHSIIEKREQAKLEGKAISGIMITLLLTGMLKLNFNLQHAKAESQTSTSPTVIFMDPSNITKDVGETFTISVGIANVTNLWGMDVRLRWDLTVIEYVNHSVRIPKDIHMDGVLWRPVFLISNNVSSYMYWLACTSFGPAPSFNGSGTIFTMTFKVLRKGASELNFTSTHLSNKPLRDKPSGPIAHEAVDGKFSTPEAGQDSSGGAGGELLNIKMTAEIVVAVVAISTASFLVYKLLKRRKTLTKAESVKHIE